MGLEICAPEGGGEEEPASQAGLTKAVEGEEVPAHPHKLLAPLPTLV